MPVRPAREQCLLSLSRLLRPLIFQPFCPGNFKAIHDFVARLQKPQSLPQFGAGGCPTAGRPTCITFSVLWLWAARLTRVTDQLSFIVRDTHMVQGVAMVREAIRRRTPLFVQGLIRDQGHEHRQQQQWSALRREPLSIYSISRTRCTSLFELRPQRATKTDKRADTAVLLRYILSGISPQTDPGVGC